MLFSRPVVLRRLVISVAVFAGVALARADVVISEFMADNVSNLADEDGTFSDWIEIRNSDAAPVQLGGWYLTDSASNRTKWQFPSVTLPAGGYLVVFASNKNRRDPEKALHTNFALSADGEYLGLIKPDGVTVASEFTPAFPPQTADVSYGIIPSAVGAALENGFFRSPTPGAANGDPGGQALQDVVTFSRAAGPFSASFTLELTGAGANQHIRYVLATPSASGGSVSAPTSSSPRYTGPITIDASVIVRAAVFSGSDLDRGATATAHFVKLSPDLAGFSTQLPVLVLDNHGYGPLEKDGIDHPAWIYAYEPAAARPVFANTPGLASPTTMTLRGNFSSEFPKQSYSLTLSDAFGRDRAQRLLGLHSSEDWAVVAPWSTDRSYIRNAFVYALSNQIGRWAPRTRFVEMFVNSNDDGLNSADYAGIGVLTDRLKVGKDRINIASLTPSDITGGYILKIDPIPDNDHYSFVTDHGIPNSDPTAATAVIVDTPNAGKLTEPQRAYIRGYVQQMENALYADRETGYSTRTYLDTIDLPSWVDHHLLELFVGNVDALYRSDYFYKDRGGKLVSGPAWDFDSSMGNGDQRTANWNTWETAGGVDLWDFGWWGSLAPDPEFMQAWVDRWQALRRNEFSAGNLGRLADTLAAQISPDAAARDVARWPDNESRFSGGFLGEIAHLKDWITHRAVWIDQQFLAEPKVFASGGSLSVVPAAGAQLVYTLDGSDPRSLGGKIAPNALISPVPIDVPVTANLHARSYRAELSGVFPGSPWSSAVGGENSSPLSPRARLVNISSRAVVGSGENALIAGVVVADTAGKRYLARAVGPGLAAFGAVGVVPDPQLSIFSAAGVELFRNNGWETGPDAAQLPHYAKSVGAFALAAGSQDSALANELSAGAYTVQITTPTGQNGVGLAELYELDANGRTVNLSTRARVGTGEGVLIGGFVVQGPAYKRMLIRAVGPTLGAFGLTNALMDPVLTVYSGSTVIASNDRWSADGNAAVINAAGRSVAAFALADNSEDAALLITLPPGAYTVEVKGKDGAEGVALLEIYDLP